MSYSRIPARQIAEGGHTNLLASRTDALKRLEEDLNRSFDMFSPKSSVDALPTPHLPPPQRQVAPSTAARDLQKRRNSWMLADPESFGKPQGLEDLLRSPFDRDKDKKRTESEFGSLFDFRDRTAKERSGDRKDSLLGIDRKRPLDGRKKDEDSDLPGPVKENAQELRKLLGSEKNEPSFGLAEPRTSLSDIFGLTTSPRSEKEVADHKAYLDSYRQVMAGATPTASAIDPLNPLGNPLGTAQPASTYAPGLDSYLSSSVRTRTPYAAPAAGDVVPKLPDVNATVLNQWNPLYTPQAVPEPPRATPPKPTFEAPRRKF